MKILIFSDLHGKVENMECFLSDYPGISRAIFAGDFFGYFVAGPRLADFVKKMSPEFVIGNHDVYYLREMFGESALNNLGRIDSNLMSSEEYQNKYGALVETCRQVRAEDFSFLKGATAKKEVTIEGLRFLICHGNPENPLDGYTYPDSEEIKEYFDRYEFDVLILGHTHKSFISNRNGRAVLNPGSCTLPRGEAQRPSVIVYQTSRKEAVLVELEQKLEYAREGKNRVRLIC